MKGFEFTANMFRNMFSSKHASLLPAEDKDGWHKDECYSLSLIQKSLEQKELHECFRELHQNDFLHYLTDTPSLKLSC